MGVGLDSTSNKKNQIFLNFFSRSLVVVGFDAAHERGAGLVERLHERVELLAKLCRDGHVLRGACEGCSASVGSD